MSRSLIDISMRISPEMPVWPGDEPPRQQWNARLADGDPCNVSNWTLGCHAGTHVDAPSHFVASGADISEVLLDRVVGEALVIDVPDENGLVTSAAISVRLTRPYQRVLLKTRNARDALAQPAFAREFVSLHPEAADLLVQKGVRTVGIDYLSVERFVDEGDEGQYDNPVHRRLLGAGVTVIEGLDLRRVEPGAYELLCLPLRLTGSEAAPARAVLRPLTIQEGG